jgi:DNA-binding NarL/FixJ family response regulator
MRRTPQSRAEIPNNSKVRVLLVDDQPIVRERLADLISSQSDMIPCGQADNSRTAFELLRTSRPNLVITGLSLKDSHGLEFVKDVRIRYPSVAVLVFSMYDETLYAERAIWAGANGFVTKRRPTSELLSAVRRVLQGNIYLSEQVAAHSLSQFFARHSGANNSQYSKLSDRELEVFQLVGQGRTTRQIADALHVDIKTVETYRLRIKLKLGLNSPTTLAQHAQHWVQQSTSSQSEHRHSL